MQAAVLFLFFFCTNILRTCSFWPPGHFRLGGVGGGGGRRRRDALRQLRLAFLHRLLATEDMGLERSILYLERCALAMSEDRLLH